MYGFSAFRFKTSVMGMATKAVLAVVLLNFGFSSLGRAASDDTNGRPADDVDKLAKNACQFESDKKAYETCYKKSLAIFGGNSTDLLTNRVCDDAKKEVDDLLKEFSDACKSEGVACIQKAQVCEDAIEEAESADIYDEDEASSDDDDADVISAKGCPELASRDVGDLKDRSDDLREQKDDAKEKLKRLQEQQRNLQEDAFKEAARNTELQQKLREQQRKAVLRLEDAISKAKATGVAQIQNLRAKYDKIDSEYVDIRHQFNIESAKIRAELREFETQRDRNCNSRVAEESQRLFGPKAQRANVGSINKLVASKKNKQKYLKAVRAQCLRDTEKEHATKLKSAQDIEAVLRKKLVDDHLLRENRRQVMVQEINEATALLQEQLTQIDKAIREEIQNIEQQLLNLNQNLQTSQNLRRQEETQLQSDTQQAMAESTMLEKRASLAEKKYNRARKAGKGGGSSDKAEDRLEGLRAAVGIFSTLQNKCTYAERACKPDGDSDAEWTCPGWVKDAAAKLPGGSKKRTYKTNRAD